ncbi:hypothetical protein QJQ45_022448, partial [Haematococcus lacustris]
MSAAAATEAELDEARSQQPSVSMGYVSTCWGHKRPRSCLGRVAQQQVTLDRQQLQGAQHQLTLDQQQLQGAQHQLALDQQQLQGAQHQLTLDQQQLQGAQHQLALDQQQLKGAQHQLGLDQQQLQGAQHQLTLDQQQLQGAQHQLALDQQQLKGAQHQLGLDQQQLQGAQHQLALDQQQLKGAQHQLALDLEKLQGAQHQLALDQQQLKGAQHQLALDLEKLQGAQKQQAQALEQLQNSRTGLERSELLLRQHMDACMRLSLREVVDKLNEQMPSYIWHHFVAHHQLAVFRRQQQAVQEKGDHGRVVISCDWSERLSVERPTEIQSDHWHHHNVGIFVACAYFRNDRDEYREETVYVLTDGKDQSAAVTQAALHQVLDYLQGERCMVMKQLCMWSDGCAAQFKGTPALQLHRRMAMRYKVSVWWSYGATSHFKGRHDSEGGVFKHSMAARVLADHPDLSAECKAQQLAGVHNVECVVPAAQLAASVAHQTRGSVQRRWCLVLKDEEVEKCAELDPDAHRLLRTITGSRAMHAMFFPADGVAPMWSETACACVRHMGSKPQQCMCHGASTLSNIPMFGRVTLASDKEEDVQCLKLLHARAPHIASSYMTLTVHLLKEYARGCLGWKGKRLTQNKPLLRADILEHLRWEQEMEEDQLAEVGVDEADD